MSRILIETMVKRALRDINDNPERGIRNLVDLGLNFSKGRFQRNILGAIQTLLKNEDSEYYTLLRNIVTYVDNDILFNFGMNIGYNSCTLGAKKIREWEKEKGYNVPWVVTMEVDGQSFNRAPNRYKGLIAEGEKLGIFSWIIEIGDYSKEILSMIESYPDSAFILMINASSVTEEFMSDMKSLDNVMIIIENSEDVEEVVINLKKHKMLYGICYKYCEDDIEKIADGSYFDVAQELYAAVTVLIPEENVDTEKRKKVYEIVNRLRMSQKCSTILWDFERDNCRIDEIISDDACFVCFDKEGNLIGLNENKIYKERILYHQSLQQILNENFKKYK